jgi:hypothetical protein
MTASLVRVSGWSAVALHGAVVAVDRGLRLQRAAVDNAAASVAADRMNALARMAAEAALRSGAAA